MTELAAIKRLAYTVGNKNKPNETDAEAVNKVIEWFNLSNQKAVNENLLFAKLYILVLKDLANHYKSIDGANKVICDSLSKPIDFHIETLKQSLNHLEMDLYLQTLNLQPTWGNGLHLDEIRANELCNMETLKKVNTKLFLETLETWDNDSVIAHLNYSVNELFNKYKNTL
jgi:hypothetical protein